MRSTIKHSNKLAFFTGNASYLTNIFVLCGILLFVQNAQSAELTHGPVFGGVQSFAAKVFVRTDQNATIQILYDDDFTFVDPEVSDPVQTTSESDFTTTVRLRQLRPETTYYINILVDGVAAYLSDLPSFNTFSRNNVSRDFKFVYLTDFVPTANVTEDHPTSSFLFAGLEDNPKPAFAFIGGDFDHRNPVSLFSKRQMFKDLYDPNSAGLDIFVSDILKKMPIVHHWDDHDAGANNIDKTYPDWNLSYQAYNEFVPTYSTNVVPNAIWHRFSNAQAEFFVLDNRSQRDSATDPDDQFKSMLNGNDLIRQESQLSWLKGSLNNSSARWKIIFSSVITNPTTKLADGWAAYQAEWTNIKKFIENRNISGVIFLSADLHFGGIDNGTASGFPEMVVPQVNQKPTFRSHCASDLSTGEWSEGTFGSGYGENGGACAGYGVVTVLTNPDRVLLEVKDEDGVTRVSHTVF